MSKKDYSIRLRFEIVKSSQKGPEETTKTEQAAGSREERVTVSGLYASAEGGGGGERNFANGFTVNGEMQNDICLYFPLRILTEVTLPGDAGSLFQYFTTLVQKAEPLLRRCEYCDICIPHVCGI